MHDTPPEIERLRAAAHRGPLDDAPGGPCEGAVFAARREAFREAVEALRELAETESGEAATALRGAALLLAARLSPDNPEGNA